MRRGCDAQRLFEKCSQEGKKRYNELRQEQSDTVSLSAFE